MTRLSEPDSEPDSEPEIRPRTPPTDSYVRTDGLTDNYLRTKNQLT